jgi:hypothetical protein
MGEHEQETGVEERVDDLDVPESESQDVKGGLPAVQKVREAANRTQLSKGGEIEVESFSWG